MWVRLLLLLVMGCFFTTPLLAAEKVYRFGVVPQFEPRKLSRIWSPILMELEKRTGFTFKMVGSPKIPDFEIAFMAGEFDFAYMNPYHAMLAAEKQQYVPLVRDGSRELFGILVVRKDSPVKTVKDLDNQKIAFPAPNALGASLLMRMELATLHGIDFTPSYVQTHSSVYLNVVLKKAAAGGGVASTLKRQKPSINEKLRILYKTKGMAPHPLTAHPRVPAEDRNLVRKAMLDMAATESGKALLSKVPMRKAVKAELADYLILKEWGLEKFYVKN